MKIGLLAFGTQGDVQPYIALGAALARAGHSVRLVTHQAYEQAVAARSLEFAPVQGNVQEVMESPELRELLKKGNFLKINAFTSKLIQEVSVEWLRVGLEAMQDRQLLMAGIGGLHPARALSQKLQIPLIEAHVVPFTPTRQFPAPLFPAGVERLGGAANYASHVLFQQVMWQGYRAADGQARREVLGLPAAPLLGSRAWTGKVTTPVLYGISPSVLPRPADWPAHVHLTGYWLLDHPQDFQPLPELQAFLEAGPTPIYLGFGSMGNPNPEQTTELVLNALNQSGERAVLLKGWGGIIHGAPPENVYLSGAIPHSWLFPRMAAVVHHGGAGTTAAGLRAGVPGVIVPFFGDQPFWGRTAQNLGVAPPPLPRKTLTAERLAQAIHTATSDQTMRHQAAKLGAAISSENGLEKAVRIVETFGQQSGML